MSTPRTNSQTIASAVMRGNTIDLRGSTWQVFRIMAEFVEGYQFLSKFKKQVTVFGSARIHHNSPYYAHARRVGELLAKGGYATVTGGGPGMMEAANRGAFEEGGTSIGLNVQLPKEQQLNEYVREARGFYYFLTRKVMLTTPSLAFVVMPGGFGTLDELFEVLDQIRYKQLAPAPVILFDRSYWEPLVNFLHNNVFEQIHALAEQDLSMVHLVDSAEEAMEIIRTTKEAPAVCSLDATQFCSDDAINWRLFRIMAELVEGFEFLRGMGEVVTVLGTPRVKLDSSFYCDASTLGELLAKRKIGVLTGGGAGIMEAANKGAREHNGASFAMSSETDHGSQPNAFVSRSRSFAFPFTRKLMLTTPSRGFVIFPGGYGTLNSCFELLTLMQTRKMNQHPVVLYGSEYWTPLLQFIRENQFEREHCIAPEDLQSYTLVDSPTDAMRALGV